MASQNAQPTPPPSSHLPHEFFQNVEITQAQFDECFVYLDRGIFRTASGWSLPFTHAVLTTGDRATNLVTQITGSAGDLWRASTRESIKDSHCCVFNCPNPKCTPDSPQQAGATAHVYATFQLPHHDISFMILLPTCSVCNNWLRCRAEGINFPLPGQQANILFTYADSDHPDVKMIFIQASDATTGGKGRAGKGTGKGGNYHDRSQAPPSSKVIGIDT